MADVLRQIDAYPVPKGVSAQTWTTLTAELKRLLIARAEMGGRGSDRAATQAGADRTSAKFLSIAPTGLANTVSDLAAVSNPAGTQATLTWTEKLAGDCDNDGQVGIADLQPIALHYGETSTGVGSPAYLADANGDGQVGITDLQPIASSYGAHLQGYRVYRGAWNGTSVDWDITFLPNADNPTHTSLSCDRPTSAPTNARSTYTYVDDVSGVSTKSTIRYKVTACGDGAQGAESSPVAIGPPPVTYTVSGTVLNGAVGLSGVTLTLTPGGLNATTQTDGTFTISGAANGTCTLTAADYQRGYGFNPQTRQVTVSNADVAGQDFTAVGVSDLWAASNGSGSVATLVWTDPSCGTVLGYLVFRGYWNGSSTTWEATFRPNVNPSNPNWSADAPFSPAPPYQYTYFDDISGLADKSSIRYKVIAYGLAGPGAESNEAIMPPPA